MSFRRETRNEDDMRTGALLDALDNATSKDPSLDDADNEFSYALVSGLCSDKAAEAAGHYPPTGHRYPRRG